MKRSHTASVGLAFAALLGLSLPAFAQGDVDALRYSTLQHGSSARALGAGGAFGALGGDFGSLSINPAGIGVFRSSEISFGFDYGYNSAESQYFGESRTEGRGSLGINSAGLVLTAQNEKMRRAGSLNRVSSSFAFGANRLANFHQVRSFQGTNPSNSLLQTFTDFLNQDGGVSPGEVYDSDPFGAGLAWETFLINPTPGDSQQYVSVLPDGGAAQSRVLESRGSITEMFLGYGMNLGDRLYFGATIGIPLLRYNETITWRETDADNTIPGFSEYAYRQSLNTTGSGLNAKLGIIGRPHDAVRLGVSIHSPTRFRLSDQFNAEMAAEFDTANYEYFSPEGLFNYTLRTPWRFVGSAAFLWKTFGFISVDYELVDYGFAAFDFRGFANNAEAQTNDLIAGKYRSTGILRLGTEIKLDNMRLRAGYAHISTPFDDALAPVEYDQARQSFSGGIGYRGKSFFLDLAYVHTLSSRLDVPYTPLDIAEPIPFAEVNEVNSQVLFSAGVRF